MSEMTARNVVEILEMVEDANIKVWLDGGWGVDALLHKQTRAHKDVDLIVPLPDVAKLEKLLAQRGFRVHNGTPPHSFTLADGCGLEIDVHAVHFDKAGNGIYLMQNGVEWIYPAEGFNGRGIINGQAVRCLSATAQVLCHAEGYKPVKEDIRDMQLLAERFELELPPQLQE